jgi:hypothetical protein
MLAIKANADAPASNCQRVLWLRVSTSSLIAIPSNLAGTHHIDSTLSRGLVESETNPSGSATFWPQDRHFPERKQKRRLSAPLS